MNKTNISQPAIYVTSIACHAAAVAVGFFSAEEVSVYAGLSLGEYTALHLAGAFSFEDGLRLVATRGRLMQDAAVATPSGMVVLAGADEATAIKLCEEAAKGEVLVPANFNAPGQIVVSGAKGACERVVPIAEAAGLRAIPLTVAGAFHSPLMQPAADRMAAELEKVQIKSPDKTVYANVTALSHTDPASTKAIAGRSDREASSGKTHPMQTLVCQRRWRWIELAAGAGC